MLVITVGGTEVYDEGTDSFRIQDGVELQLMHSLVSLSKWEEKHEKPFLGAQAKTPEELLDYVRCMIQPPFPPEEILHKLSEKNYDDIQTYMNAKMSATWFSEAPGAPKTQREVITAELVYYWLTVFNIPWEAQHWHLNKLFTLIRVCNLKQEKPKKMSRSEVADRNRRLNEQRKRQMGTKG
jgi:hypothetical protein